MMGPLPDVRQSGAGQLAVVGLPPSSVLLRDLVAWLKQRDEVIAVRERPSGVLAVQCRTRSALGLVRSVDDYIFSRSRAPRHLAVMVTHRLPGRLRLRVGGVAEDDLPRLTAWVAHLPGVLRASCSSATQTMLVVHDARIASEEDLLARIRQTDPFLWPATPKATEGPAMSATAAATGALALSISGAAPPALPAVLAAVAAAPVLRRALEALRERRASVDLLDVTAVSLSIATGQVTTAAAITWLLAVGDVLLQRSADRARSAVSRLTSLDVPIAHRIEGRQGRSETMQVPAGKLRRGDRIVVSAGRRIPADGTVISGRAWIDEKALTGESKPRKRGRGERVLAATTVVDGEAVVEVLRAGTETTAARVIRAIEGAEAKPMTLQKEAQRVTDGLVLPTFGVAGAALAFSGQVDRLISVLITDFGSGVRVALPTSALSSIAAAARAGILVKGAQYLERLARTDMVVFDKTGTLTGGEPEIVQVRRTTEIEETELLALAAGAEAQSSHPAAQAIRRATAARGIAPAAAELGRTRHVAGMGVSASVARREVLVGSTRWMRENSVYVRESDAAVPRHGSPLLMAIDGTLAGVLAYADRPRPESAQVVRQLQATRRKVMLLSGDAGPVVRRIAASVGIDDAAGNLLPDEKLEFVRRLQRQGHVVAMVGDGINDAPALAHADVGISLHGGTEIALETADIVLLDGGISKLPRAFTLGESAVRSVRRGLGLVIAPNAVAIVLGALGLMAPGLAALVNNGSTVVAAASGLLPLLETQ
jgi:Cu2+-exporting ATPase